jgi:neutral ceramidase
MSQLLAGVAKIVITPPVGTDMSGFGGRTGPSDAVNDDLRAAALYLESNQQVMIMTCDLIGLDDASVAEIRAGIAAQTGVPAGNIMIGCSHTHSGPATPCIVSLGKMNWDYFNVLKKNLIGLGKMAFDQRQPCTLGHLREPVAVGINRRTVQAGKMVIGRNDAGVTAPWVDVIAVDTIDEKPLARYFVHAAHAVTLRGQCLSADWPGYAQRIVESIYGNGCVAMFGQGCCGNINSDPVGTIEIAEAQGRVMAGAVVKAAEYCTKRPEVTLGAGSEVLQLPCFDPPTVAEAEAQVEGFRQKLEDPNLNYGFKMMYQGDLEWGERMLQMAREGRTGLTRACEVQAIRIGDFGLVGLPGEVFVEYAFQIDAHAGYCETATMAYANGNIGYVPTAAAHAEGGYEVEHAIRFYGDTMLAPESEQMIVNSALGLLKGLHGGR